MRLRILLFSLLLIFLANSGLTEESPDEWFKKGNEASEAGDHEEAIRCFERTIALDPGHIGGFRNIGCVYGMRGMWDEAIEPFIKALAINPNDAQIHYNLGFCWYKKSMFDEAIAEFEKAIALNPEFRDAYHNLGIVYGKKEMFSQAIPMFRKAVEIGPDNAETHFSLGKAYKEVGDDTLAADHYYKAGLLYLQKGHREGALAAYENVVPYSKEIADVLFRRLYPDDEASDVTTAFSSQGEIGSDIVRRPYSEEDISDSTSPLPSHQKAEVSDVPKPSTSEQEQEVSEVTERLPSEQEEKVSDISKPLPSVKAESWYVLLRRMNIRQDPSTDGKIISKLNRNAEFQIMEEAPDNNPRNSWYLIRTRSGITGWLSGIYGGNVKFKDLPQPDLLQKEIADDLARGPYSKEEISDVPKPLPSEQEEEASDSTKALSSEQEEEVADLTMQSPSEQEEEVFEVETPLPPEPRAEVSDVSKPLLSEQEQEVSEVTEPLSSEQAQEVSQLTEPLLSDQEEKVSDVAKPLPSVKAESWYVLLRRMNVRQDPSTDGKIISKLNKNAEFQIIEEAPDNNPRNSWYLIRTRSGITGWLSGIYGGNVKFKDLPQPDLVQKEIAAELVTRPHSEAEVSEVAKPLPSVKAESWYVLLRRMNIRQDPSTDGKIISKLNKNAEFQIIEEAPDNNPSNAWYLIRTRSGITGWLSGIYNGNVKFKDLSQPDFLAPR